MRRYHFALSRRLIGVEAAFEEAARSNLPGLTNGPADAYRHTLGLAEMTRRLGERTARHLGEQYELSDVHADPRARAMDLHNNDVGIAIGRKARRWEDIVRMTRAVIEATPRDGRGGPGTPVWLPQEDWRDPPGRRTRWPDIDWDRADPPGRRSPYGGNLGDDDGRRMLAASVAPPTREPEITFLHSDPANGGRPSLTFGGRLRDPALDRWLAERHARDSVESGGTVHVSAHTRRQDGRPVAVEAQTRSAPTRG